LIFIIGANLERKRKSNESTEYQPYVSVIIAARNEENNIEKSVLSVSKSNYPKDKYEIIVVNDRSTDSTENILKELQSIISNLNVLSITTDSQKKNLKGKPGAISYGISVARGEIIMMTDADCIVNEEWINSIVSEFSNNQVGLVASFTNVIGERIFDKIQAVEWAYLHTMASGGIGWNHPLGCYGNNLSIRKQAYEKVGGYENISFSVTEDLAMLQAISNSGYEVRYITKADADVDTLPTLTFADYIKQRHRWAVGGLGLGWKALIFVLSSSFLFLGLLSSILLGSAMYFSFILLTRLLWDYLLISDSFRILKKEELIKWIPLSVAFFMIIEPLVPFLLFKKNVVWKGQIFKK
jgi:cellulose synthase/poly-beta-1,6-N-acetylglucosamine synthase-like glycosyltransferase